MALRLRRGTDAERQGTTPLDGELIYTTDTKALYIGDGVTAGGKLISSGSTIIEDIVLNSNDITGTGNIDITGDITATGNIHATGNITAEGNITLGDADTDNVSFGADVNSNIVPDAGSTYDLGTSSKPWNTVYSNVVEATTLRGAVEGNVTGDLKGSVFADDSTMIVDGTNGVLRGEVIGSLTGNVTGNVSGNVTGDVTGDLTGNVSGNVTGNVTGNLLNGLGDTVLDVASSLVGGGALFVGSVLGDLRGSISGDDSTILVDQTNSALNLDGTIKGPVAPDFDDTISIGTFDKRFVNLNLSGKIQIGTYDNVNLRAETVNSVEVFSVKGGSHGRLPITATLNGAINAGSRNTFAVSSGDGILSGAIVRLPGTGELVVQTVVSDVVTTTTNFEVSAGITGTLNGDSVVFHNPPVPATHYVSAAPANGQGQRGDKAGMIFADANYIYVCRADWDGATEIWTRSLHDAW
jgi:trimeric autotransporter adhesin